ncbi:dephospho-CoA kinase, long form [Paeniglutamicibacter sp. ABSL32-1]|uniref:dephospho-CoA kinase n=1 Tax=Paeniglutamicibacter quisquiliarum TaxID=2849498 RepID=UPI001C2DE851|nr:dephospho-CoA kinase [Paeniglutamicibacter quisquiliarum]MBV1778219.1 dephospho-CoA kinase, long form [Paeniglutamicibacter quisquiliarum]
MLNVGLTGGIAAGKSAVARRLVELGAVLIDADAIARAVLEPGTPGLAEVVAAFGPGILDDAGALDRPALGALVFADESKRQVLNSIVHPRVRAEAERLRAAAAGDAVVVQDIPLLVETKQAGSFDVVLVVAAPQAERLRRMVEDRGMAEADARARIAAQATDEQRAAVADVVINNSGTLEELRQRVNEIWETHIAPSTSHAR